MNIVIIYSGSFPYSGLASSEHIISYSKGLVKHGHEVCVLAQQPFVSNQQTSSELPETEGIYEGIAYRYPCGRASMDSGCVSLFKKIWVKIRSIWGTYSFLKKTKADVVLYISSTEIEYGIWKLITHSTGHRFIVERTEFPQIYKAEKKYMASLCGRFYKKWIEKRFADPDVWIVETKTLKDYYERFARKNAQFYILPMTVEIDRFSIPKDETSIEKYIAYCGNMREDDGISILIKAFAQISGRHDDLRLKLAGYSEDVPKQKALVSQLGLEDKVDFMGRVSRENVPSFLVNAELLVLASPLSLRSCATMPCKVGEYLCTGVPVVVTGLGEINNYLKDKESAYLAIPDSPEKFASKMEEALSDDNETRTEIVYKGRQVAQKYFSAESQAKTLQSIFEAIVQLNYQ